MAKNKKDSDAKGDAVKIPIEDADQKAEEPIDAEESQPEPECGDSPFEDELADDLDEELGEDDLIAEAEAILDEAVSADELEKVKQEASEWQDRYMRLHAEWDTYRRRTNEQRAEEKQRAGEKLMEGLLPVLDDFERSVDYAEKNGETGLLEGVKAVQAKLLDVLGKNGLVTIDPAGEPFDALEAQAVGTVSDEEAFDETVRDVYQKGYKMGKKVLRPAMVTITTGGPARPKTGEGSSN